MDRQIVYPGSIPLDTDVLSIQRNTMVAIGYLAQATLGQPTIADGLVCAPTQPASLSVSVGPGSLTQFGVVDSMPFGSLGALPGDPLVRMGISLGSMIFGVSAPTGAGQAISYLVQASVLEADATPVVLPYYNAANPGQPYSGPANTGVPQMTQRLQTVQIALKAGPATVGGVAAVPAVDAGWVGLYVVTVAYGQSAVTAADIAVLPTAPFLPWKLPQLSPGTRNLAVFQPASQGDWIAPAGVAAVKLRIWGGGGAGGSGFGGAGGGGAGGGYCEGYYPVTAGQSFTVTVGNGGAGTGSAGGTSSFGSLASATGGQAGGSGTANAGGSGASVAGSGYGTGLSRAGGGGGNAFEGLSAWLSGAGGGAYCGAGAVGVVGAASGSVAGGAGGGPGGGGSGGVGGGAGGQGGAGLVLVEW
jgi:hypothetical protein